MFFAEEPCVPSSSLGGATKQTAVLMAEYAEAQALVKDCIAANAHSPHNQEEYKKQFDGLIIRQELAKAELESLNKTKQDQIAQKEKLGRFLRTLQATADRF